MNEDTAFRARIEALENRVAHLEGRLGIHKGQGEKVREVVRREGEISHSALLNKVWRVANASQVKDIVLDLRVEGEIQILRGANGKIVYRWAGD